MAQKRSEVWLQASRRSTRSGSKAVTKQWLTATKVDRVKHGKLSADDHDVFLDASASRRRAAT